MTPDISAKWLDFRALNAISEQVIAVIAVIFIFLGFGGLIIVITTSPIFSDRMLDFAYTFVYSYMLILGILLYVYRNRIIFKR
jgi:hypothetical protein